MANQATPIIQVKDSNVGVGTTSPVARLTVVGATTVIGQTNVVARFSDDINSTLLISHPASTSASATITGNEQLAFATGAVGSIAERMRITAAGTVAINSTANSVFVLDVFSKDVAYNTRLYQPSTDTSTYTSLLVSGAMTSAIGYFGVGGSTTGNTTFRDAAVIGTQSNHRLVFNTNDGERMRLTTGGNLLIGTTTDIGTKLNVNGVVNATDYYFNGTSSERVVKRYVAAINVAASGYTFIANVTGSSLASAVRMTIQGTSNSVVINVLADIQVNHFQDILITTSSGFYTQIRIRIISNQNDVFSIEIEPVVAVDATTCYVEIYPLNDEVVSFSGSPQTVTSLTMTTRQGIYTVGTGGNSGSVSAGGDIYVGENLGVGTTSPAQRLHVSASGAIIQLTDTNKSANNSLWFQATSQTSWAIGTANNASSGTKMVIMDNGNIGFGVSSASTRLDVVGAGATLSGSAAYQVRFLEDQTNYRGILLGYDTSGSIGIIAADTAGPASTLAFWTYSGSAWTEKMRVIGNGNVLIGTTTDNGYKLSVNGSGYFNGIGYFENRVASNNSFSDANNVRVLKPLGGSRNSFASGETGAIKITYPVGYTNTMHRVKLNIYNYAVNQAYTVYFGGYNYSPGPYWTNVFAYTIGPSSTNFNPTVRFGYDGTKMVVYIGELNTSWSYPQFFIEEVETGFNLASQFATDAWSIGLEASAFQNVTDSIPNTLSTNWARNGSSTYNLFGNVGIGITTPGAVLTVGTQSSGTAGSGVAQDNSIVGRFGAANTAGRVTALTIANTATPTIGNDATLSFIVGGNYSATGLISSILQNTGTARTDMAFSVYNVNDNYERMRITGGGNVGIGTSTPASLLQLVGLSAENQGVLNVSNTHASGGVYYPASKIRNTRGDHSFGIISEFSIGSVGGTDRPSILFYTDAAAASWNVGQVTGAWGIADSFGIGYRANNVPSTFNSWPTNYFTINTNGNVLIGTTTDSGYKLRVNGTSYFDGLAWFRQNANTGSAFRWGELGTAVSVDTMLCMNQLWNGSGWTILSSSVGTTYLNLGDSSATPNIDFGTGGANIAASTKMRITNGGNVLIGTTTDSGYKLRVAGGSVLIDYASGLYATNSIANIALLARVSDTSGIINYAEYASAANLNGYVIGSTGAQVKGVFGDNKIEFYTNSNLRATLDSSGNFGIGTTASAGIRLHVNGDTLMQNGSLGVGVNPNATDGRIDASNDIVAFSTSDRRLKENITPIANALDKVKALTGVEFDWIEETKHVHGYEGHDTGVIAQEVKDVMPTAIRENESGYLSVRYEKLIGLLIEANKELAEQVANQQSQIDELKKLIK